MALIGLITYRCIFKVRIGEDYYENTTTSTR